MHVAKLFKNGWRFNVDWPHPDYPDSWVQFRITTGTLPQHGSEMSGLELVVTAYVSPNSLPGFVEDFLDPVGYYGWIAEANWQRFADNLSKKIDHHYGYVDV